MAVAMTQVKGKPFPEKYMDFLSILCYNDIREGSRNAKGSPAFF